MTLRPLAPENEIVHSTIIRGLIRELCVLRMPVILEFGGQTQIVTLKITADAGRAKDQDMTISVDPQNTEFDHAILRFDCDGAFYMGKIQRDTNDPAQFRIPKTLQLIGRRKRLRLKTQDLADHPLVAEMSRPGHRDIGVLIEYDQDHLVLEWVNMPAQLQPEALIRVTIFFRRKEILNTEGTIRSIRTAEGRTQAIIQLARSHAPRSTVPRGARPRLEHATRLTFTWPDATGLKLQLHVEDVSQFGFSSRIIEGATEAPPCGAIGEIAELGLRARIVWNDGKRLGLDLKLNPRPLLGQWFQTIDRWTRSSLLSYSERRIRKSLLSMMIRSSYLKGKRTDPFQGDQPARDLIPLEDHSYSWLKRISYAKSGEPVDTHISYVKASDYSWIIQELGSAASLAGLGEEILSASIREFYFQEEPFLKPWSHLLAIYDPQSKFNQHFWSTRANFPGVYSTPTGVFELTTLLSPRGTKIPSWRIDSPTLQSWPATFKALQHRFDPRLLYSLGLGADSYQCENLSDSIASNGGELHRDLMIIFQDDTPCGFVIQLGLPPFSNLTGLTEALWVGLPASLSMASLMMLLIEQNNSINLLTGATDALVFPETQGMNKFNPGGDFRTFHTQCIPQRSLLDFLEKVPK